MGTSGLWFNLDEALIGMIQIQESQLVSSGQYRCSYKKNLIDFEVVIAMGSSTLTCSLSCYGKLFLTLFWALKGWRSEHEHLFQYLVFISVTRKSSF